jgi:hypothetical protein
MTFQRQANALQPWHFVVVWLTARKQSMLNRTLVITVFLPEAVGETIFARWSWILLTQIASLPRYWDITAPAPSSKLSFLG